MRTVKNFADVQIVLNDLLNWRNEFQTKEWDRKKIKFVNNPPGTDQNDLVIVSQLPTATPPQTHRDQHFCIPWSDGGTAVTGAVIPAYVVMDERTGIPLQLSLYTVVAPSTANLIMNLKINGANISSVNLTIPIGQNGPVFSSQLISPLPYLGHGSVLIPQMISGGSAQGWTLQLSVRRQRQR